MGSKEQGGYCTAGQQCEGRTEMGDVRKNRRRRYHVNGTSGRKKRANSAQGLRRGTSTRPSGNSMGEGGEVGIHRRQILRRVSPLSS